MALDAATVAVKVAEELARIADAGISDARVAATLAGHLVPPRPCLLGWDYGDRHPEFTEARYPGFVVAEFPESGTGIAWSEYGFGPRQPWGLIWLDRPGYGMDSGWFGTLEAAFRDSMAWDEPPPPGYEVE